MIAFLAIIIKTINVNVPRPVDQFPYDNIPAKKKDKNLSYMKKFGRKYIHELHYRPQKQELNVFDLVCLRFCAGNNFWTLGPRNVLFSGTFDQLFIRRPIN